MSERKGEGAVRQGCMYRGSGKRWIGNDSVIVRGFVFGSKWRKNREVWSGEKNKKIWIMTGT